MPSEFSMEYTRGSMPPSVVVIGECVEARSRFPDDIDEFLTDRELFLDDTQDRDLADSFAFPSDISTASCSSPFRSPSRVPSTSSVGALHCSSPLSTGSGESGEEDKQTTSPKPRPRTRGRRRAAACSKGRCVALVADKVPVERTGAGGAHDIESNEELLETGHSQGAAVSQYEDTPDTSGYLQGGEDAEETARLVLSRNSSVCSSVLGTPTITEDEDYFYFQKKGRLDPARSWLEKCRKSVHAVVRILWMRKSDEASWQTHNEKAEEDLFARRRREVAFKQQASETCWRDLQREPRLTLLLLATATAFSTHNLIAPNMSRIAGTFHFSNLERDQKIGGNLTTLYYIPGCLGALCVGIIGDAINSSRLLYGVLMLTSASTFLTSFVQTYEQLAALRVFSGLGIGGVLPLSYSVLGSWYEPEKRASSSAFLMSACGLGGFVGQSLAALLGRFDWRWPFAFTSFPLFLVSQLFFFYGICEGSSLGLRGVSVLGSSERKRRWVSLFRVRRARQEKDESWSAREGAASQSSDSVEGGFFLQHVKRFFLRGNRKYAPSTSSQVSGEDEEFRHEDQEQAQLTCSVKGSDTQPDVAETVEHCAHGNADESGAVIEQEGSCEPQKSFGSVTNLENELEEKGQQHRTCGGRLVTWAEGEQNEVKVTQNVGSTHKCRGADSMTSAAGVGPGILTLETAKAMLQTKTNLLILIQALVGSLPWGMLLVYLHDFLRVDAAMGDVCALIAMAAVAVSSFCGTVAGGFIGERLYIWNKESVLFFCACVSAVRWIPFFLVFEYPKLVDGTSKTSAFLIFVRLPLLLTALCLGGFLAALPTSNISAVLLNVNCPRARSAIFALYGVLGDIARSVGMLVVSYLVGLFGERCYAFQATMLLWLPCALAFYATAFVLRADEDRIRRLELLEKGADGLRELDYPTNIDEETPFLLHSVSSQSCSEAARCVGDRPEGVLIPSFCLGACTRM